MKNFSFVNRIQNLKQLYSQNFDLLIIGGGINGAGVARDASMRGLKVALIEARDYASGTSSKSSKLIHGGIRYLENMEFKLVFEALSERTKLFEMVPHLVHPLRFMIPIYEESRVGMLKMGLGMWLYDALSLFQAPEMHERLSKNSTCERSPTIRAQGLLGSYVYSDAYMDDDRLVLETLRSANEYGAVCANYVKAGEAHIENGKVQSVQCVDQLTNESFSIKARHVISTVGPWTDSVGSKLLKDWKKILRPTKGVHLTFSKNRLPLTSAVVMGAEKSDRIVFAIPRHEMIIIGTTDTDFKEDPSEVSTTPEDVKYLLSVAEQYFPGASLSAHDIIASYAGVRPLVHDGSSSEGKTSREHTILSDERGFTFVAGGKYTTYRLMCLQAVEKVLESFSSEERIRFGRVDTTKALNSFTDAESFHLSLGKATHLAQETGRNAQDIELLCERYGLEAEKILNRYSESYSYWQLEAAQAIDSTMCLNLRDFFTRRVPLFLSDRNHGLKHLDEIVQVFQERLNWGEQRVDLEKNLLTDFMAQELVWKKSF